MKHEVIDRYRKAEGDFKLAIAAARIKHRGEGSDMLIESMALVDCETEWREWMAATAEFEKAAADDQEHVLAAHDAAADYHRSWADRQKAWATEDG